MSKERQAGGPLGRPAIEGPGSRCRIREVDVNADIAATAGGACRSPRSAPPGQGPWRAQRTRTFPLPGCLGRARDGHRRETARHGYSCGHHRACRDGRIVLAANRRCWPAGGKGMNLMAANCKLSLFDLGRMAVDDGFFIRGATAAVQSNPHPAHERRHIAVVAAVIEHPQAGPILFDAGCVQNAEQQWPAPAWEAVPRNIYNDEHPLDNAATAAGCGTGATPPGVL